MSISAIDAMQRGLLNLRGNPTLVLLQMGQAVVVAMITFAGIVPLVLMFGIGALQATFGGGLEGWDPSQARELERLMEEAVSQWPMLLAALGAAGAVWTVGFLVYCWVQAGLLSQLVAGEERAAHTASPTAADFTVFSWRDFTRFANERIWKFFWLINLYLVVGLVALFFVILAVSLVLMLVLDTSNPGLAIVAGCLMVPVLFVLWVVIFAWTYVGKAELAVSGAGVWSTFTRSLGLLGRRIGAVALLLVLFMTASIALSVVFFPLSLGLDIGLVDSFARQLTADAVIMVIQSTVSAALVVALSSALVALVKAER